MAHAKAIFFGEHAVVYGKKGITVPLTEMYVKAELKRTEKKQVRDKILNYIAESCGIDNKTEISITSNIPVGRGLGSSAALSVAVARANNLENIKEVADKCEKFIHGNPSGIDVNQVLSDSPLLFSKKEGAKNLEFKLNGFLLVIDSGVVGITKKTVARVKENYDQCSVYIEELGGITEKVIPYLLKSNIEKVGSYMNRAHYFLQKLGVSHSSNDEIVDICLKNGALGAKLTGGGDGGCCIALTKTKCDALVIQEKLREDGYSSWIVTV